MTYDRTFFDYVDQGALRSAAVVVEALFPTLRPTSVLDVGCGRGGWASIWKQAGCTDICGIDGDHVDPTGLYIARSEFVAANLESMFNLGRSFDLVQCLEVAEHLPSASAAGLVSSIAKHGDVVLFSAAVPGQGGTHHVNERPLEYWRSRFADLGYSAFDFLRPQISQNKMIEPWYRFNSIIYANVAGQARLPAPVLQYAVASGTRLAEYGPWSWQLRKAIVRMLPVPVVDQLAQFNAHLTHWAATQK